MMILIIIIITTALFAIRVEDVGVTAQLTQERLQQSLEEGIARYNLPGATAAVFLSNTTERFTAVAGYARLNDTAMTPAAPFHWASNTKVYTSAAVMALVEAAALSLDDGIALFLPPEALARLQYSSDITVRHLLTMTSGLATANPESDELSPYLDAWTPYDLVMNIPISPASPPGQSYEYCNNNFLILGFIIQVVTGGIPAHDFITSNIVPANATTFLMPTDKTYDVIFGYQQTSPGQTLDEYIELHKVYHPSYPWTAGNAVSTAEDQALWLHELFHARTVVSPASVDTMKEQYPVPATVYGHGVMYIHNMVGVGSQLRIFGHTGGYPGFTSCNGFIEGDNVALVVGINKSGYNPLRFFYRDILIDLGLYNPVANVADPLDNSIHNHFPGTPFDFDNYY